MMNIPTLLVAAVYLVLLEFPNGSLGHHKCKHKKELPARKCDENDDTYYKRIFTVDCSSECSIKKFYESVFNRYEDENEIRYVKRIDFIFGNIYTNLDCRFKTERQDYLGEYYKCKFAKNKNENDEEYFERVLPKNSESDCVYIKKVELMRKFVKHVDWSKVKVDLKIGRGFSLIRKISSPKCEDSCGCKEEKRRKEKKKKGKEHCKKHKSPCHHKNKKKENEKDKESCGKDKEETNQDKCTEQKKTPNNCENIKNIEEDKKGDEGNLREWVKTNYCRKDNEDNDSYYKRICAKTVGTNEEYVKILTITRQLFKNMDLWYSVKYLGEIRKYYLLIYSKRNTETEEEYFKRLVSKESYECEENCVKRINLIRLLFPSLPLWYETRWYDTCTRKYYQEFYKKLETETNETYLKRVFTKCCGESEEHFWKRIKMIQKTFPSYKCWYEKENLQKLDACKCFSEAKCEKDLKNKVEAARQTEETEECKRAKLECLQTFFKSSKSSQSSQSSNEEEEIRITSTSCL